MQTDAIQQGLMMLYSRPYVALSVFVPESRLARVNRTQLSALLAQQQFELRLETTMQRVTGLVFASVALFAAFFVAGCGGGGGSSDNAASTTPPVTTPPVAVVSRADATRFLEQATFGATLSDVAHVQAVGFNSYLTEQFALVKTGYPGFAYVAHTAPDTCKYDSTAPTGPASICARDNYSLFQVQRKFFQSAVSAPDQLRQRVAFALSQIFVVSGTEIYEAYGMANYQQLLLDDAFGNFRQLLMDVTHEQLPKITESFIQ
jgi:Protein of unknown function (DUF1800)